MGPYKLVALDMDGTVLNTKHMISPENLKWINHAIDAGVKVMFATGRGIQSVNPFLEETGLQSPIVTVNGGEVWQAPNVLLKRHLMEVDWIRRMHQLVKDNNIWYWGYSVEGLYNKERWCDDLDSLNWLKFGYQTEDLVKLSEIREELESWNLFEITNSHLTNIEVNPKGINKASGMIEVCRLLGIEMSEVIAMGDSMNDLQMIKQSGLGVAMGNAQDVLKQAADLITVTNDEDGVARIIQQYIFEE